VGSILVTGGTGTLGTHVVQHLRDAGREVRVLTRHARPDEPGLRFVAGDLLFGDNLAAATEGIGTIIHCAGARTGDEVATRNLIAAAKRAGAPHLVYISVVGAERMPVASAVDQLLFGYFEMKRRAEGLVARSGLPWTTLRVTQFHDLVFSVVETLARLPVVPVAAGSSFQPVDSDEVASRLVELSLAPSAGLVPDLAGPRSYRMAELMRSYLEATHRRRLLLPLWLPGRAARAVRNGANLSPSRALGRRTWEDYLASRLSQGAAPMSRMSPQHA
jgi:uncharacterized protein YbjT (DUF2867 family)